MLLLFLLKLLFKSPIAFLIAIFLLIFPLLLSITIHEWAHGMVAYLFGDQTPKKQGRLTLNPFAHLDPVGTLMLFIVGIGWAKPVMINPDNIPGRTKQMLVALAGPGSNFIMAVIVSIIIYIIAQYTHTDIISERINITQTSGGIGALLLSFLYIVVQINIMLGIFNLLPLPPLDGSNIVRWLLPERLGDLYYSRLAPFGIVILLLILFTVGFGFIFNFAQMAAMYIFKAINYVLGPLFGTLLVF